MQNVDDGLDEAFKNFGEDKPKEPETPVTPSENEVKPASETPAPEDKKDESKATEEKPSEEPAAPAEDEKKPEENNKPAETTEETPIEEPEAPKPLTKDDVSTVVRDLLTNERATARELDTATQEVLDLYYPTGLSDVLVDEKSGKSLKTPQDVVEASGDTMSIEEATKWLMNEQYRLDKDLEKIRDDARKVAETTVNFRRDSVLAVQKYEPLFKAYPTLQEKVYGKLMKQVKIDEEKKIVTSSPDVMEFYDDYLEPYQQAFEYGKNKPATAPTPSPAPEPPKPSAEDRMDESGDGGQSPVDDPNDFAQQVKKELAKGV